MSGPIYTDPETGKRFKLVLSEKGKRVLELYSKQDAGIITESEAMELLHLDPTAFAKA